MISLPPVPSYTEYARELDRLGRRAGFAAGFWGSLRRGDISYLSDIDIVVLSHPNHDADWLRDTIVNSLPDTHVIDISNLTTDQLPHYPALNGTSFHSLYFLTGLVGDDALADSLYERQRDLHGKQFLRCRELINLMANSRRIDHRYGGTLGRPGKFGIEGTNYVVRLIQCAQLLYPDLVADQFDVALRNVATRFGQDQEAIIRDWRSRIEQRHAFERSGHTGSIHTHESSPLAALWFRIHEAAINVVQELAGTKKALMQRYAEMIGFNSDVASPAVISSEISRVVEACTSNCSSTLSTLADVNGTDWWVASNLALNPSTPPQALETLYALESHIGVRLWQTIRLYVAGNPNTSLRTLESILECEDSRPQDRKAASNNLLQRR